MGSLAIEASIFSKLHPKISIFTETSTVVDELNNMWQLANEIRLWQMIFIYERRFEKLTFPACDMFFFAFLFFHLLI
jgi:hypothetical protein